jgi:hypothetical protein
LTVVTLEEIREALRRKLGKKGLGEEEILRLADYIVSFFGYGTEVVDNRLEVDDRDVFYTLEEEGFLSTRREEVLLRRGKTWRIHYWVLQTERIKRLATGEEESEDDSYEALYGGISEEAWTRGQG